jgi:DnaJ-class molecular chaperone
MEDPYKILGVERNATEEAIRAAYRKLAKKHHPDINPGKPEAEERFKAINAAYSLLSDADKRARFDRGEIDASGAERPPERPFYRNYGDQAAGGKYRADFGGAGDEDLEGLFGGAFRDFMRRNANAPGGASHYALTVDFLDAAKGAVKRLTLPDGRTLDVTIPPGLKDGQVLRLKGQGQPSMGEGPPGDALIEVSVAPHKFFRRRGNDIVMTLPVTLKEAVLGAKIAVPTIKGPVNLTIPPNSGTGTRLRLKGRGISEGGRPGEAGDQYVELEIVLPHSKEPELAAFLEGWTPRHPDDPRKDMPKP